MKTRIIAALIASVALTGCKVSSPALTGRPRPKVETKSFDRNFSFSTSENTATQDKFDQNEVTVFFKANDKSGSSINDLKVEQLKVEENGVSVSHFILSADQERIDQVAEIVFLVDMTGTMTKFIESAKRRLHEFIVDTRAKGYHTRMCISGFGDYTVKKCTRFYDNNPSDPSTESQVTELIDELARFTAYKGEGKDPGYPDLDENPMRALIDAASAPWGQGSQRFVILVTDWGFLYSPDNQGEQFKQGLIEAPPHMSEVTAAIKASQMKVFAVTPSKYPGYNSPFQGEPGIVQSSGGEFFEFDKVLKGKISLDQILDRILFNIKTTYKLTYVVDQIPGLDPTLPLEKRQVAVSLKDPASGDITQTSVLSSMPKGRAEYKKTWKVSDQPVQQDSVHVFIDDVEVTADQFSVNGGEVTFKEAPKAGAKLKFVFYYMAMEKNFRLEPITIAGKANAKNTKVYLNEKLARPEQLTFEQDLEGHTSLGFSESILAANDPYDIRKNEGVSIRVVLSYEVDPLPKK